MYLNCSWNLKTIDEVTEFLIHLLDATDNFQFHRKIQLKKLKQFLAETIKKMGSLNGRCQTILQKHIPYDQNLKILSNL